MGTVHEINQKRYFTLDEARELLPVIRRITRAAKEDIDLLSTQGSYLTDRKKRAEVESRIQAIVKNWHQKIHRLGCEAKGMWLVDFDNGEGYYCWHFPESEIRFCHGYADGFSGRVELQGHSV